MTTSLEALVRSHWWSAVASVTRATGGDLGLAEDAVQDACAAALAQWPVEGPPASPLGWLIGVARRRAIDRQRREARRSEKEAAAMSERPDPRPEGGSGDDDLGLVFMCCHPALDTATRIALTLRCVCGLSTSEISAAFLVPEATMAKRLVRGKGKIRDAGIRFKTPTEQDVRERLPDVLKVVYLVFTEGHMATGGDALVRGELCDTAVWLARALAGLLSDEPEVAGLLALLLLTDARRPARTDAAGNLVLLEDQDRALWDPRLIAEGEAVLERALGAGRPGPYQLHAAIAACHSSAPAAAATDWRQISLLYQELIRYEPSPVVEANRAVAVAMAEGPAAGLVILDSVAHHPQLQRWPQLHVARADLLRRLGRTEDAASAYRAALELEPPAAERRFIATRIRQLQEGAGGPSA
ncbi:MAG: sigma-70 family RNA polymerase sigma factor [Candidatus Dormibacteraeota bacterium]|nr:sigma-70 family RNA polymerase sigma factor [Candidatus Dormibacteraeota bacterium]MBO0762474.1 sigma-70 family RNA polymerase sigma factor [Candidatus Dormibacteraeota bacterium]